MKKEDLIRQEMERLGIRSDDLEERFVLGSGSGGQKVNKSSTCVYLKHHPTGIEVKCQQNRSRALNRLLARRMLVEKFKEKVAGEKSKKQYEIEKIRRQKRKRSKRAKEKMLEQKRHHSDTKKMRQKPAD